MKSILFLVLLTFSAWTSSVQATIPPSQFMLKYMAQKRASLKTLKSRSMVMGLQGDSSGAVHFRQTTWYSAETGTLLSWATDDSDRKLYIAVRKADRFTPIASLLFGADYVRSSGQLKDLKIPILTEPELLSLPDEEERRAAEKTHFLRHKSQMVWVVGDREGSRPGLWLQKDTFLPLRLLYSRPDDGRSVEVSTDYYKFAKDFAYPHYLMVGTPGGAPELREEWLEAVPNAELGKWPEKATTGFTEAGNAAPSAVRELIQQYYMTLR